ncbi:MAG: dihydropteroate synthase [Pseudorhodobacter sp.]|nr:dihydropteroate synthase [Pseudorhodobacter sp.]
MIYYRPIAMTDAARPDAALPLTGGWCWFDRVEVLERGRAPVLVSAAELPSASLQALTAPRAALAGLALDRPRLMGILNVTPDSFSDGGLFLAPDAALAQGRAMAAAGADIIDIGGESTRPGAAEVSIIDETARTAPVIAALRAGGVTTAISIDTRKAGVAEAALAAGAGMVNDVAAFSHDPSLAGVVARAAVPVCLMHAQGTPATMQADPQYDDVVLDVYDFLAGRIAAAEAAGIARTRIVVDPGIGFGKTVAHNLALIRGLALFHGLGCAIVLGASRKRFIGSIGGEAQADRRGPGSTAVALAAVAQGVQMLRVHDVADTRQALDLWQAVTVGVVT